MYRNFGKEDWLKHLGITECGIPDSLLLYGIMDLNKGFKNFSRDTNITPELWLMHNIFRFTFGDKKIALAVTYGSSMTSEWVHVFSVLGVKLVLQIGSFGGLQRGMRVGDILVPTRAIGADGASDWYLPKGIVPIASPEIAMWLQKECARRGIKCHTGTIFTTSGMLAETPELIQGWSSVGYAGVDLETATTLAVGEAFGTKRAAILYLGDNIIEGGHFLDVLEEEKVLTEKGRKVVFDVALEAIAQFATT